MATQVKYKLAGSDDFQQTIMKLKNAQTNNYAASHIHHIIKAVKKGTEKISEEYKTEVMDQFAVKDADGKIALVAGQGFEVAPDKTDEYEKFMKEFEQREFPVDRKLTHSHLRDVKLSAKDFEQLGDIFDESGEGPGVPGQMMDNQGNIHHL